LLRLLAEQFQDVYGSREYQRNRIDQN